MILPGGPISRLWLSTRDVIPAAGAEVLMGYNHRVEKSLRLSRVAGEWSVGGVTSAYRIASGQKFI